MAFINETGAIYQIITGMTTNTTGSDFLTIMLIILMFLLIGIILKMNMMTIALFLTPLSLVLMAYDSAYTAFGVLMLIALGVGFAKNIMFQRF